MTNDKRTGGPPVPGDLHDRLNPDQLMTLRQIENFGWQIAFVRRPLFQDWIVVVSSADGKKIGVLEEDGRLNLNPDIKLRD